MYTGRELGRSGGNGGGDGGDFGASDLGASERFEVPVRVPRGEFLADTRDGTLFHSGDSSQPNQMKSIYFKESQVVN